MEKNVGRTKKVLIVLVVLFALMIVVQLYKKSANGPRRITKAENHKSWDDKWSNKTKDEFRSWFKEIKRVDDVARKANKKALRQ